MNDDPETNASLLLKVTDPSNVQAWQAFSEIYRPVVFRVARGRGLQHADAEELAQQVLIKVVDKIATWRANRNSNQKFLPWLRTVARNAAINLLQRRPPDLAVGGSTAEWQWSLSAVQADPSIELDLQYRRQLFRTAAETVRQQVAEQTWQAFWLTSVEGISIHQAAKQLSCGQGTIYAARSRVMRRLQAVVQAWESQQNE